MGPGEASGGDAATGTGARGRSAQRRTRRAAARRGRRTAWIAGGALAIVAAVAVAAVVVLDPFAAATPAAGSSPTPSATPTPTETAAPLTEAERLLASADDPNACAVTFAGDGIDMAVVRQDTGTLYRDLPLPARDGLVFAGWYPTAEDAAAFTDAARINGSKEVACTAQQSTLYAGWMSPEQFAAADVRVPILMYHQFTTNPEGEAGWLKGNYAYIADFEAEMNYLATTGFYYPTWGELEGFIDGRVSLPARSVIVTDDDADQTWFDLAVPIVDKYKVLTTSFMITAYRQDPPPSPYVLRRSHTHDLHKAGASGKGLMVNLTPEEIAADLRTSADILGVGQVVAYPFGHYDQRTKDGVAQAGYAMGRTIEPGYVVPGTDKYALPVVRINYGSSLDWFIRNVG